MSDRLLKKLIAVAILACVASFSGVSLVLLDRLMPTAEATYVPSLATRITAMILKQRYNPGRVNGKE